MAKQTENKVGIYLRLSQEDLREGDSVSIDNQRMILTKFVKEKGWTLVDTYVDAFTPYWIQQKKRSTAGKYAELRHFRKLTLFCY